MTSDLLTGFRGPANRRRDQRLKIMVPLVLVEAVAGGALGWAIAAHQHRHHRALPWWVPVLIIVAELALILAEWSVMLLIHRRRHGTWLPEPAAVLGADKPVRKRVGKAFRTGRLAQDRTERALTLDLAAKTMRVRWVAYLSAALVVLQLPVVIFDHRPPVRLASAVIVVSSLLVVGLYAWMVWRARRIQALDRRTGS